VARILNCGFEYFFFLVCFVLNDEMLHLYNWLYVFGFALISIAHFSIHKRCDTRLLRLIALSLLAALIVGGAPLVNERLDEWRHVRQLRLVQEGELAVRTLLLTKRGLAKLVGEANAQAEQAQAAADAAVERARRKALDDARRGRHKGEKAILADDELDDDAADERIARLLNDDDALQRRANVSVQQRLEQQRQIDAASDALLGFLPDVDYSLKQRPYARCAVVGNSGALLASQLGAEIDAHDLVLRFNYPPLAGYERDVGNRTDWMFTGGSTELRSNHHPFMQYSDYPRENTTLILFPPSLERMADVSDYFRRPDMPRLHFLSPYFVNLANRVLISYLRVLPGNFQRNAKVTVRRKICCVRESTSSSLGVMHIERRPVCEAYLLHYWFAITPTCMALARRNLQGTRCLLMFWVLACCTRTVFNTNTTC
jgi:hypothetical protein